nr:protein kinase [Actinomycetota bacterium]
AIAIYAGSLLDGLPVEGLFARTGIQNRLTADVAATARVAALGFYGLYFLVRVIRWRRHRFLVTTHRLIETSGFLGRRVSSVPLVNISDLRYRRSLPGRAVGYGDVMVTANGRKRLIGPLPRRRRVDEAVAAALMLSSRAESDHSAEMSRTRSYTARPEPSKDLLGAAHDRRPNRAQVSTERRVFEDRYALGSRIASGGMGTVYEGVDQRLRRPVAIKLLNEGLAGDARFVERFRREALAVASLSHPNIAALFDYGEEDETPFIVMELLRGRDLGVVLAQDGALSPGRSAAIVRHVLDALQHGHEAGVVHRDVKPANVIVDDLDGVKVTDFRIARAAGNDRMTATGIAIGSVHYMSPEQVRGQPAGPHSDIYSAGILLYEMLTGAPPFAGATLLEVAERNVVEAVPLPSLRAPGVPSAMDEIVVRATAKHPGDRFPSAGDMATALSSIEGMRTQAGMRREGRRRSLRRSDEFDTPRLSL